jgi:hypothetical protein
MMKLGRLSLLTACMVVLAPAAMADDAALAAKLVGNWEGRWEFAESGGKLTAKITSSSGNSLKGETTWYATAVGDFSDRFTSAKLKDGKLKVAEQTMDFEATVSEDGTTMTGTWTSPMASGPMSLKKKVD